MIGRRRTAAVYLPLANYIGGFESTSFWHRVFALVTFACFGMYMVRLARVLLEQVSGLCREVKAAEPKVVLPPMRKGW